MSGMRVMIYPMIYIERYAIMGREFPSLCKNVISAYTEFRKKIKNKLFI